MTLTVSQLDWKRLVSAEGPPMFFLGIVIIVAWIFCFFYYDDLIPRNVNVGMMMAGLFLMGWGLLKGKNY